MNCKGAAVTSLPLTIAIPTYNRRSVVSITSRILQTMPWLKDVNLRIYDDCSELSVAELRQFYPTACEILKRGTNFGADAHIPVIFENFLKTNDDWLLMLDSDLIVSEKLLAEIRTRLPLTDGFLTVYNSYRHATTSTEVIEEVPFDLKASAGSAGTVLSRDLAQQALESLNSGPQFDLRMAQLFRRRKIRLLASPQSYVQHIGFDGANCQKHVCDLGRLFDSDRPEIKAEIYRQLEFAMPQVVRESSRLQVQLNSLEQWLQSYECHLTPHLKSILKITERRIRKRIKRVIRRTAAVFSKTSQQSLPAVDQIEKSDRYDGRSISADSVTIPHQQRVA